MPEERKLKGVNFHGTMRAVERKHGAGILARVKDRIEGEAGEAIRNGEVVTGGWYPAAWYDALLRAIEAELPPDKRLLRDLSREAVKDDFATIFKVLSLIVSPEGAMKNATKIAARYIDGGKITLLATTETSMHFRFEDYHGYTSRMWEDFIGGVEAVIDLMRLKRLPTKILSGGGHSPNLEVMLNYQRT